MHDQTRDVIIWLHGRVYEMGENTYLSLERQHAWIFLDWRHVVCHVRHLAVSHRRRVRQEQREENDAKAAWTRSQPTTEK